MLWLVATLAAAAPCPSVTLTAGTDTHVLSGHFCWSSATATTPAEALQAGGFVGAAPEQAKLPRSDAPLWIRHQLTNRDHPSADWVLELWTVPTDAAEVFVLDGDRVVSTARVEPPPTRSYYPFQVQVPRGETRAVLTRLTSSRVPVAPVRLSTPAALVARDFDKQLVMGLFFGLGLALILYNAFLYAALRQASYLAYVAHAATVWILVLGENGLIDVYFHRWVPRWSPLGTPMLALTAGAAVLFTRIFLFEGQRTRVRRLLDAVVASNAVVAAALLVLPLHPAAAGEVVDALLLASIAGMMGAAAWRLRSGYVPARDYLVAWGALFVPILLWLAEAYGLIGQSVLTRYASEIGVSLEMLLMSLALASSLNLARRAAQRAERSHSTALEAVLARQAAVNEALTVAHQRAVEANELKTAFLTKVSHELRTPLNHVVGMTAALQETQLDEEQREMAGFVAQGGEVLSSMVERLLDLSALERGDWVPEASALDVRALVEDVVASRRAQAVGRGLSLVVVDGPAIGPRLGDRAGIRRVLIELVDNALRFTSRGGVRIAVQALEGDGVRIDVVDTGSGVPEGARAELFGLFSQLDDSLTRAHGGLGVGLAIAQRVVARLGGTLTLVSEEGKGSTFSMRLSLRRGAEPAAMALVPLALPRMTAALLPLRRVPAPSSIGD